MSGWDPEQYLRFEKERWIPFEELISLIELRPDMRVVDLGCGTGAGTAEIARRLDAASVLGIDRSETMLERAERFASKRVRFDRCDIEAWSGEGYDLVVSNAALHWVEDHARLFERIRDALVPGGQLAVQMPNNMHRPTHTIAREVAAESPFAEALAGRVSGMAVLTAEEYAELFATLGFEHQTVREVVYLHQLPNRDAVFEWVRGSMLSWVRACLEPGLYARYLERYRARLFDALPDDAPLPFTYRRILLWAKRPLEISGTSPE